MFQVIIYMLWFNFILGLFFSPTVLNLPYPRIKEEENKRQHIFLTDSFGKQMFLKPYRKCILPCRVPCLTSSL